MRTYSQINRQRLSSLKRRRIQKPREIRKIIISISILVLLITIVGALIIISQIKKEPKTDLITLCPKDRAPDQLNIIILDISDKYSEPQRIAIQNEIEIFKDKEINKFGMVVVFTVDGLGSRIKKPELKICNPGTGSEMSELYANPTIAKNKWLNFSRQIDSLINNLMSKPASSTSPIFEAIQSAALLSLNRSEFSGKQKNLVIISDLIQNMPDKMSQYDGFIPFSEFKKSEYFQDVRADLQNVNVVIFYLKRAITKPTFAEHYRFWEEYFIEQGASVSMFKPIFGEK